MTRTLTFSESFWDEDFCGTAGYDTLVKKLIDGRQMCKDWNHFIRERAKIEEEYALKLQKLAKMTCNSNDMGTMSKSWEEIKSKTDAIAAEHILASKEMMKASERIQELMQNQKQKRLQEEQRVTKSSSHKKDLFKKTQESKKTFHTKSNEADTAERNINTQKQQMGGNVQMNSKEWEKILVKSTKLKQEAQKADNVYKDYLTELEKSRQQWEVEMTHLCDEFESLEAERIMFLRNELWVHTNIISQTAVDDDEHCEDMRTSLQKCDVDIDLTEFIEKRRIGSSRPARLDYEGWGPKDATYRKSPDRSPGYRPPQPLPSNKTTSQRTGAL